MGIVALFKCVRFVDTVHILYWSIRITQLFNEPDRIDQEVIRHSKLDSPLEQSKCRIY